MCSKHTTPVHFRGAVVLTARLQDGDSASLGTPGAFRHVGVFSSTARVGGSLPKQGRPFG